MPDKLDWLNRHPVLLRHGSVREVLSCEKLELSSALSELAADYPSSEDFLHILAVNHRYQDACTFLGYNMHHRAAVWWAYLCVLDLRAELRAAPHQPRDIADIGKPRPFHIPDWAQPAPEIPEDPALQQRLQEALGNFAQLQNKVKAMVPPKIQQYVDDNINFAFKKFKEQHGYDPMELLHKSLATFKEASERDGIDEKSPIFKAEAELKAKVEQVRQDTVKLIKQAVPDKDVKKITKLQAQALDAVFAYIAAPSEDNARLNFNLGNACPDTQEGMLSLVAFWSFGNLTPGGAQIIPTPPGLMANGLKALLLQCALKEGGIYKFKERYERYFKLGFDVVCGKNNWGDSVEEGISPHVRQDREWLQKLTGQSASAASASASQAGTESAPGYSTSGLSERSAGSFAGAGTDRKSSMADNKAQTAAARAASLNKRWRGM